MSEEEAYVIKNWHLLDDESQKMCRLVGVSPNNIKN